MLSILIGFIILITLIVLKVNIVIVAPISASVIALLNNINILELLNSQYLAGFANFVQDYLLIFLLSAILGKTMEDSGDAAAIGEFVLDVISHRYAAVGIFFASAVLTYGGISAFVLIFTIYPIAKSVFEEVNLSKSLILASIVGGSLIIGMPMPGSPQIHNLIMMDFLSTSAVAGLGVGITSVAIASALAVYYLIFRTKKLLGEQYYASQSSIFKKADPKKFKSFVLSVLPLLT
ncbi:MAG: GntP family permease, partial [Halanaerobium sp. MSAO_Bac5]